MSFWSKLCEGAVKLAGFALLLLGLSCSGVFYQPIKGALVAPERFGASPEEVTLTSADGTKLSAWALRAENPKGTILQFHGNAENMSSHFLNLWWLVKEGYDLLVFDYRGYGFSDGIPTQPGVHLDALAALDWAYHDHKKRGTRQFIVFGQSLGGQISARAMHDFKHQAEVSLLVLDSTFPSYQDIAAKKLRSHWLTWLFSPLGYVLVSDEYASEKVLAKLTVPVLGMHAKDDPVVPYELGLEGYQQVKHGKAWWKLPHQGHTDGFHYPKTPYRQKFLEFLTRP